MGKTHEIAGRTGNLGQSTRRRRRVGIVAPTWLNYSYASIDLSSASDRLPDWAAQSLRARLCFVTQAGSKVCWSPTLRKVAYPCRSGLDVLEVHWGLSEAETRSLLVREFGMTLWEGSDV